MITGTIKAKNTNKITAGGKPAQEAYDLKIQKYNQVQPDQNNLLFRPIIFETTGRMHEETIRMLKLIAGINEKNPPPHMLLQYQYAMGTLSVVLQKKLAETFQEGRKRVHGNMVRSAAALHYNFENIQDFNDMQMLNGIAMQN